MNPGYEFSVVFPCFNSSEYTEIFLNSIVDCGYSLSNYVAVNNGSIDTTSELLASYKDLNVINNKKNYGFGIALNQGVMFKQTEWTILSNNDLVVSNDWVENLINSAIKNNLRVISPALIEGEYDYDLNNFTNSLSNDIKNYVRKGDAHAVCLAVHESVWDDVGLFRPFTKLFGYEDKLFFHELNKKKISTGISGASWLHHYGSITQKKMKKDLGLKVKENIADSNHSKLLCQNFFSRKLDKFKRNKLRRNAIQSEILSFGISVLGTRSEGEFIWDQYF